MQDWGTELSTALLAAGAFGSPSTVPNRVQQAHEKGLGDHHAGV